MIIEYSLAIVKRGSIKDPLPENWRELEAHAGKLPDNFRHVQDGHIYRSAIVWAHQLSSLREQYKIHTIISLLKGEWLDSTSEDTETTIHHFATERRRELYDLGRIVAITDAMRSSESPFLVHCLKGETRTGMVLGAYLIRSGLSSTAAYFALRPFGFQLGAPYDVLVRYRKLPLFEDIKPGIQRESSR